MELNPLDIAAELEKIHTCADVAFADDPNQRVYTETELLRLFLQWGLIKNLEAFKQLQAKKVDLKATYTMPPGEIIRQHMIAQDMGVYELAKKLEISATELDRILEGQKILTSKLINALAEVFNIDTVIITMSQIAHYDRANHAST